MRTSTLRCLVLLAAGAVVATLMVTTDPGRAQHQHGSPAPETSTSAPPSSTSGPSARTPRRVTMEDLHRTGGVPRGWKFAVPTGDVTKGRQIFADLECYKCHLIKGELLPAPASDGKSTGPELTGMGDAHPAEYFAESILAPNNVIVDGPGYNGPDGLSTMPSYLDLSLAQWLDLVAYLKSLTGASGAAHGIEREQVAGDYRIRLVYLPPGHTHQHHTGAQPPSKTAPGRLSVFVTDRQYDEPIPYLPVSVAVQAVRRPTERLRLGPRIDDQGFHYGLDTVMPPRTQKLTVSVGTPTVELGGSAKGKFAQPVSVVFDWDIAPK